MNGREEVKDTSTSFMTSLKKPMNHGLPRAGHADFHEDVPLVLLRASLDKVRKAVAKEDQTHAGSCLRLG